MGSDVDVAIVGAGLAGLTAARELERRGLEVVVLEAQERVGGRTLNHELSDGTVVELGGQWIGPTQDRLAALADEIGVATFRTWDQGEHLMHREGELSRYEGEGFGLPPHVLADLAIAQFRINRLSARTPLASPWSARSAARLDAQTVAGWIRRNVRTSVGRRFLELLVAAVFAAEPEDISMLHFLFYLHSGGDLDLLTTTTGGAQESRFVGGSQTVALRLAETLNGPVRVGAPVIAIERRGDDATRLEGEWGSLTAARVVVAVPPTVIGRISFDPPLSGRRFQLFAKMPAGYVIKCIARYERPFWREQGLSGQAVSLTHPVTVAFDNSPHDESSGVLLGFLEGGHARRAAVLPAEARRDLVIDGFTTYFGARAGEPLEYVEHDWAEDEWIRGCYGAHLGPGVWTHYGPLLGEPLGAIHWAGSETSPIWNGYMDGAVRSGERVAAEVAAALGR